MKRSIMSHIIVWLAGTQTGVTIMGSVLHRPMVAPIVACMLFNIMAIAVVATNIATRGTHRNN